MSRRSRNRRVVKREPSRLRALQVVGLALRAAPVLLCLWFVCVGAWRLWNIEVGVIRIEGDLAPMEKQRIERALAPMRGAGFWTTTPAAVASTVEALPWVARAHAHRSWPPAFTLRIVKHRARAVWRDGRRVDDQGRLFAAEISAASLPRLSGPEGSHREVWRRFDAARAMLAELRGAELDGGCCWRLYLNCGQQVVMDLDQPIEEFGKFAALWRQLGPRQRRLRSADIRYSNGMALRWREESEQADCATLARERTTELIL